MINKRKIIEDYKDKILKESENKIHKFILKQFPLFTEIKQCGEVRDYIMYSLKINGKKVEVGIDDYNNTYIKRSPSLTIKELQAIHQLLVEHLENKNSYKYRTGTSFFVDYYKLYNPKKEFIKKMFKINTPIEYNDGGLKNWLVNYEGWKD